MEMLSKIYGHKNGFYTYTGSSALYIALSAIIDQQLGKKVLIPSNLCHSALRTIVSLGLTPIIAKPENRLYFTPSEYDNLVSTYKPDVCLVVHMYGFYVDPSGLIEKYPNTVFIEDFAQYWPDDALSDNTSNLRSISITSFGKSKPAASDYGGAIFVSDPSLLARIQEIRDYSREDDLIPLDLFVPTDLFAEEDFIAATKIRIRKFKDFAEKFYKDFSSFKLRLEPFIRSNTWNRIPVFLKDSDLENEFIKVLKSKSISFEKPFKKELFELEWMQKYPFIEAESDLLEETEKLLLIKTRENI